uniref:palmitoyl-monogalactosyldiacylglycerol delta-7 desaturase, chloroplastic-like n=1 Tax=Erigeron canadensis TaxID=72917 RepID=UPI001CB97DAB|nr:palmitoyl-monogalactosyldiacylglycerol delta-7 desaturase, chloroplastic-like [Erigeron canadensis]
MTNLITYTLDGESKPDYKKIWMSDVVVVRNRNLFLGRKWKLIDVVTLLWILTVHLLSLFAPFTFTWGAFWAALCASFLSGFGITLSYHRNLAHRSFKLPKWLEYIFAYIGVQAAQRDPIFWVSIHRSHHQYVDSEKDPHSPTNGFWFSHIGWLLDSGYIVEKLKERKNVEDLKSQLFYRFIRSTYLYHLLAFAAVVYAFGGFSYLVWVVGVRITFTYHLTFLINSACHIWGTQVWNTGDLSKNNMLVALISYGEGWHNNHHAFEYSARFGLEWWQFDPCWFLIKFLERLGLATNVKLPTAAHKLKRSFTSPNNKSK